MLLLSHFVQSTTSLINELCVLHLNKMEFKLLKVCRACMADEDAVMDASGFGKMTEKVFEMYTYCTALNVSESDGLPTNMCPPCMDKIYSCYHFINICKSTDTTLREYLSQQSNHKNIKEEEDMEMDGYLPNKSDLETNMDSLSAVKFEIDYANEMESFSPGNISEEDSLKLNQLTKEERPKRLKSGKKLKVKKKKKKLKRVLEDVKPHKELKKEYSCPVCGCSIVGKKSLNLHLSEQHEDYRRYICHHCNKGFAKSHYLTQHLVIHTDMRPYSCDLCPKTYKQRGQLITHRRLHSKERPYSCDKCVMSFNMKCALVNHSRLHHGDEPNLCHLCGASFAQVGNLVVHMRSHTGEKPYSCSVCGFRCSVQSGMRRHERTHENLRKYVCSVCAKGFNNSSSLQRHLRIHTGELPYKCDYCSKAFIDNWKRKNHLVKAHNISLENIPKMIPGRKRTYMKKDEQDELINANS